ncbi:MAG: cytochrome c [Microscillaceae bacterium]|nr:cytochrome c [Microscillaceae bacterium]
MKLAIALLAIAIMILLGLTSHIFIYWQELPTLLADKQSFGCGVVSDEDSFCGTPNDGLSEHLGHHLFEQNCQFCHSTTDEIIIGPGLRNVALRLDTSLIKKMIRNYTNLVEAKHPYATKLFLKYNETVMTSFEGMPDDSLNVLVDYLVALAKQSKGDLIYHNSLKIR